MVFLREMSRALWCTVCLLVMLSNHEHSYAYGIVIPCGAPGRSFTLNTTLSSPDVHVYNCSDSLYQIIVDSGTVVSSMSIALSLQSPLIGSITVRGNRPVNFTLLLELPPPAVLSAASNDVVVVKAPFSNVSVVASDATVVLQQASLVHSQTYVPLVSLLLLRVNLSLATGSQFYWGTPINALIGAVTVVANLSNVSATLVDSSTMVKIDGNALLLSIAVANSVAALDDSLWVHGGFRASGSLQLDNCNVTLSGLSAWVQTDDYFPSLQDVIRDSTVSVTSTSITNYAAWCSAQIDIYSYSGRWLDSRIAVAGGAWLHVIPNAVDGSGIHRSNVTSTRCAVSLINPPSSWATVPSSRCGLIVGASAADVAINFTDQSDVYVSACSLTALTAGVSRWSLVVANRTNVTVSNPVVVCPMVPLSSYCASALLSASSGDATDISLVITDSLLLLSATFVKSKVFGVMVLTLTRTALRVAASTVVAQQTSGLLVLLYSTSTLDDLSVIIESDSLLTNELRDSFSPASLVQSGAACSNSRWVVRDTLLLEWRAPVLYAATVQSSFVSLTNATLRTLYRDSSDPIADRLWSMFLVANGTVSNVTVVISASRLLNWVFLGVFKPAVVACGATSINISVSSGSFINETALLYTMCPLSNANLTMSNSFFSLYRFGNLVACGISTNVALMFNGVTVTLVGRPLLTFGFAIDTVGPSLASLQIQWVNAMVSASQSASMVAIVNALVSGLSVALRNTTVALAFDTIFILWLPSVAAPSSSLALLNVNITDGSLLNFTLGSSLFLSFSPISSITVRVASSVVLLGVMDSAVVDSEAVAYPFSSLMLVAGPSVGCVLQLDAVQATIEGHPRMGAIPLAAALWVGTADSSLAITIANSAIDVHNAAAFAVYFYHGVDVLALNIRSSSAVVRNGAFLVLAKGNASSSVAVTLSRGTTVVASVDPPVCDVNGTTTPSLVCRSPAALFAFTTLSDSRIVVELNTSMTISDGYQLLIAEELLRSSIAVRSRSTITSIALPTESVSSPMLFVLRTLLSVNTTVDNSVVSLTGAKSIWLLVGFSQVQLGIASATLGEVYDVLDNQTVVTLRDGAKWWRIGASFLPNAGGAAAVSASVTLDRDTNVTLQGSSRMVNLDSNATLPRAVIKLIVANRSRVILTGNSSLAALVVPSSRVSDTAAVSSGEVPAILIVALLSFSAASADGGSSLVSVEGGTAAAANLSLASFCTVALSNGSSLLSWQSCIGSAKTNCSPAAGFVTVAPSLVTIRNATISIQSQSSALRLTRWSSALVSSDDSVSVASPVDKSGGVMCVCQNTSIVLNIPRPEDSGWFARGPCEAPTSSVPPLSVASCVDDSIRISYLDGPVRVPMLGNLRVAAANSDSCTLSPFLAKRMLRVSPTCSALAGSHSASASVTAIRPSVSITASEAPSRTTSNTWLAESATQSRTGTLSHRTRSPTATKVRLSRSLSPAIEATSSMTLRATRTRTSTHPNFSVTVSASLAMTPTVHRHSPSHSITEIVVPPRVPNAVATSSQAGAVMAALVTLAGQGPGTSITQRALMTLRLSRCNVNATDALDFAASPLGLGIPEDDEGVLLRYHRGAVLGNIALITALALGSCAVVVLRRFFVVPSTASGATPRRPDNHPFRSSAAALRLPGALIGLVEFLLLPTVTSTFVLLGAPQNAADVVVAVVGLVLLAALCAGEGHVIWALATSIARRKFHIHHLHRRRRRRLGDPFVSWSSIGMALFEDCHVPREVLVDMRYHGIQWLRHVGTLIDPFRWRFRSFHLVELVAAVLPSILFGVAVAFPHNLCGPMLVSMTVIQGLFSTLITWLVPYRSLLEILLSLTGNWVGFAALLLQSLEITTTVCNASCENHATALAVAQVYFGLAQALLFVLERVLKICGYLVIPQQEELGEAGERSEGSPEAGAPTTRRTLQDLMLPSTSPRPPDDDDDDELLNVLLRQRAVVSAPLPILIERICEMQRLRIEARNASSDIVPLAAASAVL